MHSNSLCSSQVKSQNDEEDSEAAKKKNCAYLNSVRANYTICCKYPMFVSSMKDVIQCNIDCSTSSSSGSCCVSRCLYVDKLNVLTLTEDENGAITNIAMNTDSLVASFLASVGNDPIWVPVTTSAVERCYNDIWGTSPEKKCGYLPNDFFNIVDCVYTEHFLKCPVWNPKHLIECSYTYKYVDQCWT